MKKQFLSICLTGILVAAAAAAPAEAANLGGATLTTGVNLRKGPGTNTEIITTGYQSEPVIVTSDTGTGWYEVI